MSRQHIPILLAEDNPSDVFLVRRALEMHKIAHELTVAADGEAAMHLVADLDSRKVLPPPALILLDLNLPRGEGSDILRELRSSECCRTVPVIVLSSSDSQRDRDAALQAGATHFFHKPTNLADFMTLGAIVHTILAEANRPMAESSL